MQAFTSGPFTFTHANGMWSISYGAQDLGGKRLPASASRDEVREAFSGFIGQFRQAVRDEHWPARISLIDSESDDEVAHFLSDDACDMRPALVDDRSRYWIRSADRLHSRPVSLSEFADIAAAHEAPPHSWIAGLLPDSIITQDASEWRAPTSWEIRHVVGEDSFTGLSGARAAELVGVTPQNFRKYTARDDASTRQNMSFAMWHLLLHKLGVQRA